MERVKIRTTEKSEEAIYLPKSATDLANDKQALVSERPAAGNEKPTTHASNLATHWFSYWRG